MRNRVANIQKVLPSERWRYCRSRENPADLGTRGISARELAASELWLRGPDFIKENCVSSFGLSVSDLDGNASAIANTQAIQNCFFANARDEGATFNVSSFCRLQNIVARILRLKVPREFEGLWRYFITRIE